MPSLKDKVIIITGASRGIGRAMAIRFAQEGATIVIAAKSEQPHPKLPGTIHTVAKEVEEAGGTAIAVQLDVRKELAIKKLCDQVGEQFGRIDAVVNNAGAISLTTVEDTSPKRYDLMQQVNSRAVYCFAHYALPYLKKSDNPHILSLSPPVNLDVKWLKDYSPYSLSKYGMSILSRGMAEELKPYGIAVNTLWPETYIATAAIEFAVGNKETLNYARKPEIMADASYIVLTHPSKNYTGLWLIDEQVLKAAKVTDFSQYAYNPEFEEQIQKDLFLD
ncbi:SDR family oxidoreductase [Kangiella koreensis]|uniref:Short-chain dehydrogenase/reductase SDR n=1 Tax=Kangiella koreensis (strain DSM 16069 / JCM 12317 / KCTC 12182 / SW-125) TaxID=523791 RepID=C7RA62_KANKD|nr:NAD(P)-dependent oxidoreductase [Kangiella koreensis]ACV26181.1 short-chain dehydrogenase/reductase SDR [Kangiella koreensis DSM 16069]